MAQPLYLSLDSIREGGKRMLARALSEIEARDGSPDVAALLDEATKAAQAHVVGLTGPPGVGKSTLTNALIRHWRDAGESVGVIAVDPSSKFTRGALLGDRTRLETDPRDQKVFVRSMAARDRLGGLSHEALSAIILMRAVFDRVIVESVGIGQSEADIAYAVDTIVLCIQPGSGDSLQFMKAGVMELPDIVVVTKADMGAPARRARADVEGALSLALRKEESWTVPVLLVSATEGDGLPALMEHVQAHYRHLCQSGRLERQRSDQTRAWLLDRIRWKFGSHGLSVIDPDAVLAQSEGPFSADSEITATLSFRLTQR
nr:methylmalonyl Co-A mutase-associated GTPase MeaB [uncultured Cohaesibacter sp.]